MDFFLPKTWKKIKLNFRGPPKKNNDNKKKQSDTRKYLLLIDYLQIYTKVFWMEYLY